MKILWLSHFVPYPPKGGVLQRGYHLLKQTSKEHEVHLLSFQQDDLMAPLFDNLEQGLYESKEHLSALCESVKILPIPSDKNKYTKYFTALKSLLTQYPYNINWLLSEEYAKELQKLISENTFDFIHFDTISLAPFKEHCMGIPCSLDHHNIESHMLIRRAKKESNLFKKAYYMQEGKRLEAYEKKKCPEFNFNFTCSDIDTQRLISLSPTSKVHTIANGVDTEYFNPEPFETKQDSLLFIGTLSWYPNIEAVMFIANVIWPKIKDKLPSIHVDIIGVNPPQELVELSKQDPRFHVHGFVDDIIPFFKKTKCYVCPIKDGGGTKLKIVDALSMGMAIIADPIACEGIDVTDRHDVYFAQTQDEYVDGIIDILSNENTRHTLESNSRQLATDLYSYDSIGLGLSNLFIKYAQE